MRPHPPFSDRHGRPQPEVHVQTAAERRMKRFKMVQDKAVLKQVGALHDAWHPPACLACVRQRSVIVIVARSSMGGINPWSRCHTSQHQPGDV